MGVTLRLHTLILWPTVHLFTTYGTAELSLISGLLLVVNTDLSKDLISTLNKQTKSTALDCHV